MKIVIDDKTFYLHFVHSQGESFGLTEGPKFMTAFHAGVEVIRFTRALISYADGTPCTSGTARCHPNDMFDKKKGRKVALTKCLEHAPILMMRGPKGGTLHVNQCKRVRGLVWKQYWQRVKR